MPWASYILQYEMLLYWSIRELVASYDLLLMGEGREQGISRQLQKSALLVGCMVSPPPKTPQSDWSLIDVCGLELIYFLSCSVYFCEQMDESYCSGDHANICRVLKTYFILSRGKASYL